MTATNKKSHNKGEKIMLGIHFRYHCTEIGTGCNFHNPPINVNGLHKKQITFPSFIKCHIAI